MSAGCSQRLVLAPGPVYAPEAGPPEPDQVGLKKAAVPAGEGRANLQEEEMTFKGTLKRISHRLSDTGKAAFEKPE